jgi:hypothetical protein
MKQMTSVATSHAIKKRESPNDVFLTPPDLALKAITMVDGKDGDVWLDPFKNTGNYYRQFPVDDDHKRYTEILEGLDFFQFHEKIDVICSNPPYSMMDQVLVHSCYLQPRVINYLIGINNLTARRIEMMNDAGYGLTRLHMCKVFKWYGMSCIVQFEKGQDNIITFDRQVWK